MARRNEQHRTRTVHIQFHWPVSKCVVHSDHSSARSHWEGIGTGRLFSHTDSLLSYCSALALFPSNYRRTFCNPVATHVHSTHIYTAGNFHPLSDTSTSGTFQTACHRPLGQSCQCCCYTGMAGRLHLSLQGLQRNQKHTHHICFLCIPHYRHTQFAE